MKRYLICFTLLTALMSCFVTAKADPCVNNGVLEIGGAAQQIINCQVYTNNGLLIINKGIVSIMGSISGQNQFINKGTLLIKKNAQLILRAKYQQPSLENDGTIYVQGLFHLGSDSSVTNNGNIFIANTGSFLLGFNSDQNSTESLDNNGLIDNYGIVSVPLINNNESGIFYNNSSGQITSSYPSGSKESFAIGNDGEFNVCQNGTIPGGAILEGKPINFIQYTC